MLLVLALIVAALLRQWRIAGVAVVGIALNVWPMVRHCSNRHRRRPPAPAPCA
jgi:Flp pilus assembly protein TadB